MIILNNIQVAEFVKILFVVHVIFYIHDFVLAVVIKTIVTYHHIIILYYFVDHSILILGTSVVLVCILVGKA